MHMRSLISTAAICAAAATSSVPAAAATATWKSDVAGSIDDESMWVDGYKPQAGDTLDFSAVTATGMESLLAYRAINGTSAGTQFKTITGLERIYLGGTSDGGVAQWNVEYLEYGNGTRFVVGSQAQLNVSGKITVKGSPDRAIFSQGSRWIVADELVFDIADAGIAGLPVVSYDASKWRLGRLTTKGGKQTNLAAYNNVKNSYIIGSGGMGFGDGADSGSGYFAIDPSRSVRIDPSADWTLAHGRANDNLALQLLDGGNQNLEIGTSDFDDNTIPRTVTFEGGIGTSSGLTSGNLTVDGIGTLVFNTVTSIHRFKSSIKVKDKATLAMKDSAVAPLGEMNFAAGTTLKVEQTSATGTVELGGTLSLAANSTLEFVLAENSAAPALKVSSLTLPETGTVNVKFAGSNAGRYTLAENLPSAATAGKFAAVNASGASTLLSVYVEDGKLVASVSRKAVWKSNAGGNMSVAANWVDDYVPQDGDTLDFSALSGSNKAVTEDFNDGRGFETVIAPTYLYMGESPDDGHVGWKLKHLTYSAGTDFCVGSAARLQVEGRIALTGSKTYFFNTVGSTTVVAGEIANQGDGNTIVYWPIANAIVRAGKLVHEGTGFCRLTCIQDDDTAVHYVVGAGGIGFGGSSASGKYWYCDSGSKRRTVRIDPAADYGIAANPSRTDNMAISMSGNSGISLYFGTTDADDPSVARTVTFNGGLGGYQATDNVIFDGIGNVVFTTTKAEGNRFPGTIQVKDSVKFILRDTATTTRGPMAFDAGTTLKVEQTGATGTVELGGSLALASNSTLEFVLAENSAAPALKVAALTMPASGKVRVKTSGIGRGGSATLIDNLPAGTMANQFEFAVKPYETARLVVRDGKLMIEKGKGTMIIICGGAKSAPVAAKLLFAGDSTLDDHGRVVNPYASWGTALENLMKSGCRVDNYAKSGASTRSFRVDGYWSSLLAAIRPGDFVGIQFGHNDQKPDDKARFAAPDGLFRVNVRQFVADVRALGGKPILLSPIVRCTFDEEGILREIPYKGIYLSEYATAMRELSAELGVDFVDMNALTRDLLVRLGKDESAKFFAASAGISNDYSHPISAGANAFARLFVKNVKDRGLEVAALFA